MSALKNLKHEAFCQEYLRDRNAKAAAIRVGYSERSATSTGFDLLQRDDIKERIAELSAAYLAEVQQDAGSVLREMVGLAMFDIGDVLQWGSEQVLDDNGMPVILPNGQPALRPFINPINSGDLTPMQRRAIKSVSISDKGTFKLELHDRMAALNKLWEYTRLSAVQAETEAGALVSAIDQLARVRGSAMPIGNPAHQDEDDA